MTIDQPAFQPAGPPDRTRVRRRRFRAKRISTSPVIARCRYVLRRRDGRDRPLDLRIRAPEQINGESWCAIEIDWPNHPVIRWVIGGDSVQALLLALQHAGKALYDSPWHRQGRLRCPDQDGGYGLPVAPRERHRLVGEDRDMV